MNASETIMPTSSMVQIRATCRPRRRSGTTSATKERWETPDMAKPMPNSTSRSSTASWPETKPWLIAKVADGRPATAKAEHSSPNRT